MKLYKGVTTLNITKSKEIDNKCNSLCDSSKNLKVQALRSKEYYTQIDIQDKLYLQSKQKQVFRNLLPLKSIVV